MAASEKKARIAILGCGRQAWLGFLPWIRENPHATLAAVADINEEQAKKTARKFGATAWFTNWQEMLDKSGAGALIVTTPPWLHAEPTVAAAQRGMHVLCEKPMATNTDDCRRMIAACAQHDVFLQIGFSYRFDPGYEKLKTLIAGGEIGRVFQLKSEFDAWVPDLTRSPFKEITELAGRLKIWGSSDMGAWRMTDERAGGGVFMDHGIHYVDMFRWLLDDDVDSVMGARHWITPGRAGEDHASCMLRFSGGADAHVEASLARWSARNEIDEGMIHGHGGCLRYSMDQSWYIRGFPHLNNVHARVWKFGVPSLVLGQWQPVPVPHGRRLCMFKRQLDFFVGKITGHLKPHPVLGENQGATGRDGLRAIQIAHALYESAESGRSVAIEHE